MKKRNGMMIKEIVFICNCAEVGMFSIYQTLLESTVLFIAMARSKLPDKKNMLVLDFHDDNLAFVPIAIAKSTVTPAVNKN
jgi:hypothetical protein